MCSPGIELSSQADAREVLTRYSDFYQTHTLKQYMVGDRMLRQWTLIAAREQGIAPTLEGGLDFRKNLTEAIDGFAGASMRTRSCRCTRTSCDSSRQPDRVYATLLVQYGGPFAENYWYEHYNVHDDAKLRRFTPHNQVGIGAHCSNGQGGLLTASTAS